MSGRKRVNRSARAASIDSEPEGLIHDVPIGIVRMPSQNLRFAERSNENSTTKSSDLVEIKDYFDTKFSALQSWS